MSTFDYETSALATRANHCRKENADALQTNHRNRSGTYLIQNMRALSIISDDDLPTLDRGFLIDNRAFARVDGLMFVNGFQTDAHLRLVLFDDNDQPMEFRIQTISAIADALDGLLTPVTTASRSH